MGISAIFAILEFEEEFSWWTTSLSRDCMVALDTLEIKLFRFERKYWW